MVQRRCQLTHCPKGGQLAQLADKRKNPFADEERFLGALAHAGGKTQATLSTRNTTKEQYVTARSTDQMAEV